MTQHTDARRDDHSRESERIQTAEDSGSDRRIGRRRFVLTGSAVGTGLLAGCSGGQSNGGGQPDPIPLDEHRECDVCGMVISEHPGPNGQIFYRENSPENHDNPARFDSTKACLFPYYFEHEQRGWTPTAVYVTDYSQIDYEISTAGGRTYIETATGSEMFANADDVVFVVGSEVHGAMGPDFIPFSDEDDGRSFTDEFGGRIVRMDDITPEMLSR